MKINNKKILKKLKGNRKLSGKEFLAAIKKFQFDSGIDDCVKMIHKWR